MPETEPLTKALILAMPAGLELDALVATRVLGAVLCKMPRGTPAWAFDGAEAVDERGYHDKGPWLPVAEWRPSVSMATAWHYVVEGLRKKWHVVQNDSPRNLVGVRGTYELQVQEGADVEAGARAWHHFCSFERNAGTEAAQATAETMPLAICRAAVLLTLEADHA